MSKEIVSILVPYELYLFSDSWTGSFIWLLKKTWSETKQSCTFQFIRMGNSFPLGDFQGRHIQPTQFPYQDILRPQQFDETASHFRLKGFRSQEKQKHKSIGTNSIRQNLKTCHWSFFKMLKSLQGKSTAYYILLIVTTITTTKE